MIRKFIKIFTFGLPLILAGNAAESEVQQADHEKEQYKLYAVVDDGMDEGKRANAIGHMSVGLGAFLGTEVLRTTPYTSADDVQYHHISEFPFIVLKGNSSKLRKLYSDIIADGTIPHVEFLETMHLGPTFKEQIEATKMRAAAELRILGIALFGPYTKLKPFLKRFSLLK